MRISSPAFIAILLVLSYVPHASAQANTFSTNLSLSSRGAQVTLLQQMLNRDPDTRIASAGPGSPGNETDYFGSLTKAAVVRFQAKYASEVLTPAGLMQGNGYVGLYTRTKLNALSVVTVSVASATPSSASSTSSASTTVSQNPNLKNLELYIAAIKEIGLKQGMSPDTLSLIEDKIRKEVATTTDFRQQFFDKQKAAYEKKLLGNVSQSPVMVFFEKAFSFISEPFIAEKAYAGLGLPFGGYITYVNPWICNCPPGITQIFVTLPDPNPLTSNLLLNYVDGSEAFSWYNIPEPGIAVLGTYIPTPVSSCWFYTGHACVSIPAEGQITPEVGSSLVPG